MVHTLTKKPSKNGIHNKGYIKKMSELPGHLFCRLTRYSTHSSTIIVEIFLYSVENNSTLSTHRKNDKGEDE
jgi:hypothetical protein